MRISDHVEVEHDGSDLCECDRCSARWCYSESNNLVEAVAEIMKGDYDLEFGGVNTKGWSEEELTGRLYSLVGDDIGHIGDDYKVNVDRGDRILLIEVPKYDVDLIYFIEFARHLESLLDADSDWEIFFRREKDEKGVYWNTAPRQFNLKEWKESLCLERSYSEWINAGSPEPPSVEVPF